MTSPIAFVVICSALMWTAFFGTSAADAEALKPKICGFVSSAQAGRVVGTQIASVEALAGVLLDTCTYVTADGDGGPGYLSISIFRVPTKADDSGMTMRPGDVLVPVKDIGDDAVMNARTNELKFRTGNRWFHIMSRGVPCAGVDIYSNQDDRDACNNKRNAVLSAVAATIIRGAQ